MLGRERIQALLAETLRQSRADQTEIVLVAHESALTRFANSAIHQNVYESNAEVRVRAVVGRRTGVPVFHSPGPGAPVGPAETAPAIARLQPENPSFPGLPGPAP